MLCFYWEPVDQFMAVWWRSHGRNFNRVSRTACRAGCCCWSLMDLIPHITHHRLPLRFFAGSQPPPQVINVLITTNRELLFQGFAREPASYPATQISQSAAKHGARGSPVRPPASLDFCLHIADRSDALMHLLSSSAKRHSNMKLILQECLLKAAL